MKNIMPKIYVLDKEIEVSCRYYANEDINLIKPLISAIFTCVDNSSSSNQSHNIPFFMGKQVTIYQQKTSLINWAMESCWNYIFLCDYVLALSDEFSGRPAKVKNTRMMSFSTWDWISRHVVQAKQLYASRFPDIPMTQIPQTYFYKKSKCIVNASRNEYRRRIWQYTMNWPNTPPYWINLKEND